ncbi:MAG: ABC transporter permease subunit [Clostridium sp.]|nr:ABC transporter permease subunit [Clostridium sp.]
MNNGQLTLIKKDIRSITSNKQIFAVLLIVPLVLTVVLPSVFVLVLTQKPDAASDFQKLLDMPPFFLIVPIMASSVMAASSFVGEKEKHTLETLLYSPLSLRQLFQSKVLLYCLWSEVFIYKRKPYNEIVIYLPFSYFL